MKRFTEVLDDGTTIEIVDGWPTAPVYVNEARAGALVRRGLAWRFESAAKGFTGKGGAAGFTWKGACRGFVRSVQEGGGRVARYVWLLRSRVKTGRRTAGSSLSRAPPAGFEPATHGLGIR